jgi:hypothetical protein
VIRWSVFRCRWTSRFELAFASEDDISAGRSTSWVPRPKCGRRSIKEARR